MQRRARLDLKDVTLCAADTANRELAARSIEISMAHCRFGDAILFTDAPLQGSFRTVPIGPLASRADYSRFILKELHARIDTPFVLVTQWDGYVVDPSAWIAEFLSCDYIGARWAWHKDGMTVGNGGFSLRSRKLLRALADPRFAFAPGVAEDEFICRVHRPVLAAEFGIRFAPDAIAERFSYERTLPDGPTFGFHGLFNLWRHVEDAEMVGLAEQFGSYLPPTREYVEILAQYFVLRKFAPLRALYGRLRPGREPDEIRRLMAGILGNDRFAAHCVRVCEALLARPEAGS